MRFRLPLGRRLFLLVASLLLLVLLLPLRVALDQLGLDERGLSSRQVTGPIWSGRLTEARLRGFTLGDLDAGLAILPLLIGEARIELRHAAWSGTVIQSSDETGVADLTGRFGPEALPPSLPVGSVEFTDVAARFSDGVCAEAAGSLRVEPRGGALANFAQLQGNLRCDGDALLAPLASGLGRERVDLRLFGDGRYRLSLIVQAGDPVVAAALSAAGFIATAEGLTLTSEGSL